MDKNNVQIGMKVVPKSKSVGCSLEDAGVYKEMKRKKQPFLYVTHQHAMDKEIGSDRFLLSDNVTDISCCGDYFKSLDFEPYVDKWDTWISNAKSDEERQKWQEAKDLHNKTGFDFQENWLVDTYRHKCGHLEILQCPPNHSKEALEKEALEQTCTKCICGLKHFKGIPKKEEENI